MAVARNLDELRKMIMKQMAVGVENASTAMEEDTREGLEGYYRSGSPNTSAPFHYVRTDTMKNTPRRYKIKRAGDTVTGGVYLETSHQYDTASKPTMLQVLNLANYGIRFRTRGGGLAHPTAGKRGFWEKSLEAMDKSFNREMNKALK